MHDVTGRPADEFCTRCDVPPLILSTGLQGAAIAPVQLVEVERLKQNVAELGVRDAALETSGHHVAGKHSVDGEVLADVTQEVQRGVLDRPVVVVDDPSGVRALGVNVLAHLLLDGLDPLGDDRTVVHLTLTRHLRITDETSRPTNEKQRLVTAFLQGPHQHQLNEVTNVKALGSWVETHIEGDGSLGEVGLQCLTVGGIGNKPSPLQVVQQIRHVNFLSLRPHVGSIQRQSIDRAVLRSSLRHEPDARVSRREHH